MRKYRKRDEAVRKEEKREKRDELLDGYLIDLSDYKFNRDEANDYE